MPAGGVVRMKFLPYAAIAALCLTIGLLRAQTSVPVIMQAATPAPAAAHASNANNAADAAQEAADLLEVVREMQETNAATIKKQQAALAALEELQKAADELKIFSKRG